MSTTAIRSNDSSADARVGQVDLKLEVITIPVSDFDRAKEFYGGLGWRLDADFSNGADRAIQFTPPGSQCSIHFGKRAGPGSAPGCRVPGCDVAIPGRFARAFASGSRAGLAARRQ